MDNSELFVGLDIGTTSIKALVCENVKRQLKVVGVGIAPSTGLNHGVIVDIDKTAHAISQAIAKAEEKSNLTIKKVIVGLPANYLKMKKVQGMLTVASQGQSREIVNQDVVDVAKETLTQNIPPERAVLDLVPTEFSVDGFGGIKDPRGMVSVRLEMKGTLYTGPKTIIHNTKKAVQRAGYEISDFVITPIATDFNLLNDGEQDFGTVVIDLGGGQTTTSIVHDHQLKYTFVDPEGGQYVTKDISTVLNTSLKNAEKLKLNHGYADHTLADREAEINVNVVGKNEPVQFDEEYLAEVIEARMRQIFERIHQRLQDIHAPELPGGVTIIGGGAAMPGIKELAQQYFSGNIKVYVPEQMGIRHPGFATSLSLAMYESQLSDVDKLIKQTIQQPDIIESPREEEPQATNGDRQMVHQWSNEQAQPTRSSEETRSNKQEKRSRPKENKHSFGSKLKGMFDNLFD